MCHHSWLLPGTSWQSRTQIKSKQQRLAPAHAHTYAQATSNPGADAELGGAPHLSCSASSLGSLLPGFHPVPHGAASASSSSPAILFPEGGSRWQGSSWVWQPEPAVPALGSLWQEHPGDLEASLGYTWTFLLCCSLRCRTPPAMVHRNTEMIPRLWTLGINYSCSVRPRYFHKLCEFNAIPDNFLIAYLK